MERDDFKLNYCQILMKMDQYHYSTVDHNLSFSDVASKSAHKVKHRTNSNLLYMKPTFCLPE